MFGSANEAMYNKYMVHWTKWSNMRASVYNENLFMYMMNAYLHNKNLGPAFHYENLMDILITSSTKKKSKYENLLAININPFLSQDEKNEYIRIYNSTQRAYTAMSRFAFIWKYKRAVVGNSTDMMMNEIKRGDRGVVEVYQSGSVFLFRTSEVNRIVENSICNTEYMFPAPKTVKNPFNNLPFTKANLYAMYFGMDKMFTAKMPIIFYNYFACNFNLKTFYDKNQTIIRDKGISDYLKNTEESELYDDAFDMLDYVETYTIGRIHFDISDECCKCCIVKIMKPYLKLYFIHKHSLNKYEIKQSFYELRYKLFGLLDHNPQFGRKLRVRCNPGLENKRTYRTKYNLDHPCNAIAFDKDKYNDAHLDVSFVDQEEYPYNYEDGIAEPILMQHIRFNRRAGNVLNDESVVSETDSDDESVASEIDSDDESVILETIVQNDSSELEEGEILEDNNEPEVEVGFELDFTGDTSAVQDDTDLEDMDEIIERATELCVRLDTTLFEEADDNTDNTDV
jgi:hypothetical protein|uniref:Uncharacterized protein n=1 Tax=viral metagenome TaxID=1070528 RepID=A0A6C0IKZ8_9ZZZZ